MWECLLYSGIERTPSVGGSALVGDITVVSARTFRSKRKAKLKVNNGNVLKDLIVCVK